MTNARLPREKVVRAANIAAQQNPAAAKRLKALAVMAHNCTEPQIVMDLDDFMLIADHYE